MSSANGEKTRDVEKELLSTGSPSRRQSDLADTPDSMYSRRQHLLRFLALSLLFVGAYSAVQGAATLVPSVRTPRTPTLRDQQRFQELLNSVEPSSLHEVLHEHVDKYKHGVFQEDKTAIAVVHQQAPEVASTLVELAKRAGASSNGTGSVPPSTSTTAVTTEATSTVVTPIVSSTVITVTSVSSSSTIIEERTSVSTSFSTSIETSTGVSSSEVVVASSSQTQSPESTSNGSPSSTTSSGSPSISTSSTLPLSTQSNSPTDSSEPTSSGSSPTTEASVTSLNIFTTTLPDGKPTTVTQTTVVLAGQADQTQGGGSSTKTGPGASLQTNVASTRGIGTNIILGIIGMIFFNAL